MKFKRAQSGIEFIILVGFLMSGFTLFFLIIQEDRASKVSDLQNSQIKEIGLTLKNEIDLAYESSDGYTREFELPRYTYGSNFTILVTENLVLVSSTDLKHSVSYSVSPVTGNVKKIGVNIIRKVDGEVKLNE
ncbi:MAG: hypothetical protein IH845_02225 [Nanoarchaeota archaeon]|nr:hypothetical protein [Nanoarchaeota archaeon]